MSDPGTPFREDTPPRTGSSTGPSGSDPLVLLDECLATLPEGDPRITVLYKIRHLVLQQSAAHQQQETELKKINTVVEKLTAPANRIGTLIDLPNEGMARIMVGGSEYYANIDPRLQADDLNLGAQILVNEAYVVIHGLGYDENGPIQKVKEVLDDGRLRMDQEPGRQGLILRRASKLKDVELKVGDEVRVDSTHRFAIERMENQQDHAHRLDEVPSITWDQIGGQQSAIAAIRRAIEYPLLHAATFEHYQFTQPKGFLLHGPPGCGKTLIGQATAASLAKLVQQKQTDSESPSLDTSPITRPPIMGGVFLHVKGPENSQYVGRGVRTDDS